MMMKELVDSKQAHLISCAILIHPVEDETQLGM